MKVHPNPVSSHLNSLHLQRLHFQIRSHSDVLGGHDFLEDTIQPSIIIFKKHFISDSPLVSPSRSFLDRCQPSHSCLFSFIAQQPSRCQICPAVLSSEWQHTTERDARARRAGQQWPMGRDETSENECIWASIPLLLFGPAQLQALW